MEPAGTPKPHIFFALLGDDAQRGMRPAIFALRRQGIRIEIDYSGGGLKKQMGLADKLGAPYTLIVGENELKTGQAILRNMADKSQTELPLSELIQTLPNRLH